MKFRKKPVVIEATQWFRAGDNAVVSRLKQPDPLNCELCDRPYIEHGALRTLEDTDLSAHIVCPGDWIITGVKGEHYACKPDIFVATYESEPESPAKEQPGEQNSAAPQDSEGVMTQAARPRYDSPSGGAALKGQPVTAAKQTWRDDMVSDLIRSKVPVSAAPDVASMGKELPFLLLYDGPEDWATYVQRRLEQAAAMIEKLGQKLAASGNYVADAQLHPQKITFANGRIVKMVGSGYLYVGYEPPAPGASDE